MARAPFPRERQPRTTDSSLPRLPPDGAFVVQLERWRSPTRRPMRGRVEHVSSGEARHFHSLAQLLAFMRRLCGDGG